MTKLFRSNWFLLALACVFAVGHFGAEKLSPLLDQTGVHSITVMLVMWATGITLAPDAVRKRVSRPSAGLLAIGTNLFFVPALCLPATWFFSPELGGGMFVAGLVPCTLASASVWTRRAGGDASISIMTTVVTYLACVVVAPLGIQVVLALHTHVAPLVQMQKLAWFVVLPLVVSQMMRRLGCAPWADRNKRSLAVLSQCGILVVVLLGAIAGSDLANRMDPVSVWAFAAMVGFAVTVHLMALSSAIFVARRVHLPPAEQIAIGFSGSQKTLVVGLHLAIDCGVSVLPMLVYHAGQLIIDTLVADRWRKRGQSLPRTIANEVDVD